jgi:hypothetical protein
VSMSLSCQDSPSNSVFSFNTWFNTMDDHYIDFVANTFQKIEDASTVSTTSNIIANCNDPSNFCSG